MEEFKTNEIAVIEQLPIIVEKIKEIGENLDKRLEELKLDELVCNEETRKSIKELKATLEKEKKEFEEQRKIIKAKINEPYDKFNAAYEKEIKSKYEAAGLLLKTKIDDVELEIKNKTIDLAIEFFNEQKASRNINEDYLRFDELNLTIGVNDLTEKGALVKKVKDAIIEKVDNMSKELEAIQFMQYPDEILVEYLKNKNITLAIKEVNDRHMILDAIKETSKNTETIEEKEIATVEKVNDVLQAPVVEEKVQEENINTEVSEIYEVSFTVRGTIEQIRNLKAFLNDGGYNYE